MAAVSFHQPCWRQNLWSRRKISKKILCYVLEGAERCAVYDGFYSVTAVSHHLEHREGKHFWIQV